MHPKPGDAPSPAVELLGAEGVEDIQCVPCQEGQNPQDDQDRSLLLHTKKKNCEDVVKPMVRAAELSRMFWDEWKLCCVKALKEAGLMVRGRLLVSSYLTETHIEGDRKVDACLKNHLER